MKDSIAIEEKKQSRFLGSAIESLFSVNIMHKPKLRPEFRINRIPFCYPNPFSINITKSRTLNHWGSKHIGCHFSFLRRQNIRMFKFNSDHSQKSKYNAHMLSCTPIPDKTRIHTRAKIRSRGKRNRQGAKPAYWNFLKVLISVLTTLDWPNVNQKQKLIRSSSWIFSRAFHQTGKGH